MAKQLEPFRWHRLERGFRVVRAYAPRLRREVEVLLPVESHAVRRVYEPLKESPRLFEGLARVEDAPEAFAAFANKWGPLGVERVLVKPGRGLVEGEPVMEWRYAVRELREAFGLWAALAAGQASKVESVKTKGEEVHFAGVRGTVVRIDHRFGSSDPRPETAVALVLEHLVTEHLEGNTGHRLLYDPGAGRLRLHVGATTLIGAAWLQLAEGAAGGERYKPRKCARRGCPHWFVVESKRGHDTYCGSNCRVAAHRIRKRAYALHAEGKTPSAIAKALGTETGTVRGWLAQRESTLHNGRG